MPRKRTPPKYRRHSSGQARVEIDGKVHYLGAYGSRESHAEYERLIAEWRAGQAPAGGPARTVDDLVAEFWVHAERHYAANRGELDHYKGSLGIVATLYGHTPARDFGPRALKTVQAEMVRRGWCTRVVNRQIVRVRTCWRWAESEGMVPGGTWEGLRTVRGLPVGENEGRPVPEEDLLVSLAFLPHVPWAMAQTQLLTGARPSEVIGLRPCDLLRDERRVELAPGVWLKTGGVWVVNLKKHKTAHRGFARVLLFGPRAQEVLAPFLDRPPEAFLFSPREAVYPKQVRKQRRRIGVRYRVDSFGHAVRKACERAWVEPWTPYQLRHNAGTRLAAEFGAEMARIVLGHRDLQITRRYVVDDLERAVAAIGKVG